MERWFEERQRVLKEFNIRAFRRVGKPSVLSVGSVRGHYGKRVHGVWVSDVGCAVSWAFPVQRCRWEPLLSWRASVLQTQKFRQTTGVDWCTVCVCGDLHI